MWHAQLDGIGADNRAIAYDRRGFGETRAEKESFSAVADLMAVIDATADVTGLLAKFIDRCPSCPP